MRRPGLLPHPLLAFDINGTNVRLFASKMPASLKFEEIANFDASRGLTRCAVPGIGTRAYNQVDNADFGRNGAGDLLLRFDSVDYRYSFCARTRPGAAIADQIDEFTDHVSELLLTWLCDGVDDAPELDFKLRNIRTGRRY